MAASSIWAFLSKIVCLNVLYSGSAASKSGGTIKVGLNGPSATILLMMANSSFTIRLAVEVAPANTVAAATWARWIAAAVWTCCWIPVVISSLAQ